VSSLAHIAPGQTVLPSGWQAALSRPSSEPLDSLSDRQLEVLRLGAGRYPRPRALSRERHVAPTMPVATGVLHICRKVRVSRVTFLHRI
jgi:hypothetical protein